jgi:hypothetical protein
MLRVWIEQDRDGVGQPSELRTLSDVGVIAISVEYRESNKRDRWGNRFKYRAKVKARDPRMNKYSYDVFLVSY